MSKVYCEDCVSYHHNCGTPLCTHVDFGLEEPNYVFKEIPLHEKHPYCKYQNHDGMCPGFQKKIKGWKTISKLIWKLIKDASI